MRRSRTSLYMSPTFPVPFFPLHMQKVIVRCNPQYPFVTGEGLVGVIVRQASYYMVHCSESSSMYIISTDPTPPNHPNYTITPTLNSPLSNERHS